MKYHTAEAGGIGGLVFAYYRQKLKYHTAEAGGIGGLVFTYHRPKLKYHTAKAGGIARRSDLELLGRSSSSERLSSGVCGK